MNSQSHHASHILIFVVLSALYLVGSSSPAEAQNSAPQWFVDLPESRWERIPGAVSLANSVAPIGAKQQSLEAWNGATIDQDVGEMVFAANGGHLDSSNNQVFGFLFRTDEPQWRLLAEPSAEEDRTQCASDGRYADGTVASTHSYGAHAYIPATGEIALTGLGSAYCSSGNGKSRLWTWSRTENVATRGWEFVGPWGANGNSITAAAWDPVTSKLWWTPQYGDVSMISYDPVTKSITDYFKNDTSRSSMTGTAATAGNRGLYVSMWVSPNRFEGQPRMWVYRTTDPVNNWWRVREESISGLPRFEVAGASIVWHAASESFIVYPGTGAVIYKGLPTSWETPNTWNFVPIESTEGGVRPDASYTQGLFHKMDIIDDMGNGQSALVLIPTEESIPLIYKLPGSVEPVPTPNPPADFSAD